MKTKTKTELDAFTRAYIECALWSSMDESDEDGGEPMDDNYSIDDLADETLAAIVEDCQQFQRDNTADIESGYASKLRKYTVNEYAGHDFWLTRNGNGAGFWDGDWLEPQATRLSDAADEFGEFSLYVGDDGKIYC